jgi:hypothetical protein
MKLIVGAMAIAILTGCATSPVPSDEARLAPAARITDYQRKVEGGGQIVVTRDSGFSGGGCYATVFLNGKPVARLNPKEKAVFQVPSGEWLVGAGLEGQALCGINPERLETEVIIKPGQEKKFRIYTSGDGSVGVKPTTF